MKKIRIILTTIISIFILYVGIDVFAASASLSVSSGSVQVGTPIGVSVHMSSSASWNLHVSCNGTAVINEADSSSDGMDKNNTFSGTYTPSSEGTVTCTLTGDVTGANDDDGTNVYGSQTVAVTAQQNNNNNNNGGGSGGLIPVQPSNNNNNNNSNNNTSNNDNNNQEEKKEEKKSDNSKIKTLTVDNYNLKKINDNKYELTVANKVNMINIKAVAADSKATVKGNGVHELTVGENKIEVIITAEDGSKNTITILVTREEENVEVEPTNTVETTDTEPENKINIISIIMIGLNIVLAIAVVTLFIKNKKLKESLVSNK